MSKPVAIIHFQPLEFYPPVCNLLKAVDPSEKKYFVFSINNGKGFSAFQREGIIINRYPGRWLQGKLNNTLTILAFNIMVTWQLFRLQPCSILYYETLSSFPVFLYKFLNKKVKVFAHCHEYFSPVWYTNASVLVRFFASFEKKLFRKVEWISHTNVERIRLFHKDNPSLDISRIRILPNYPPAIWTNSFKQRILNAPVKIIYVGALSFSATYIREFCEWVRSQNGAVTFDIYCYNAHNDAESYLISLNCPFVNYFSNGVEYDNLPGLLNEYNVGVILYKGTTPNFEFNAPNKLFEYLVCGLNVVFPSEMKGCIPYINTTSLPYVEMVNFKEIEKVRLTDLKVFENTAQKAAVYRSEDVYMELEELL